MGDSTLIDQLEAVRIRMYAIEKLLGDKSLIDTNELNNLMSKVAVRMDQEGNSGLAAAIRHSMSAKPRSAEILQFPDDPSINS